MQKQLLKTAFDLQHHPASALSMFQKTLTQPSYFYAPRGAAANWVVLLGPRTLRKPLAIAAPLHRQIRPKTPRWQRVVGRTLRRGSVLHQEWVGLQGRLAAFSLTEIPRQRQAALALGRKVQRLRRFVEALQPHAVSGQPLFSRMLSLQAQRLRSLTLDVEELAQDLHSYTRLARKSVPKTAAVRRTAAPVRSTGLKVLVQLCTGTLLALRDWLMHPVIDTRPIESEL
jgi:hypothetical protein